MTKPRLDVLDALHQVGGRVRDPEGAATRQLAEALGYTGSLTGLKRVLAALDEHGYVTREPSSGRIHTIELTEAGEVLLTERGLINERERGYLIEDGSIASRERLVLATRAIAQRLIDWSMEADLSKSAAELRFEAANAFHDDLAPRLPEADELAVMVARTRMVLGSLLDAYLTGPDEIDRGMIDAALYAVLDMRRLLIGMRKAVPPTNGGPSDPEPTIQL